MSDLTATRDRARVMADRAQCGYMRAAYPDLDAEDTCSDHRHDAATFALARAFAVACQSDKPTDEQIGWMLDDAAAVVDDFDPLPTEWTVTEPQITDEPGLDFTLTVNDEPYVIQQSEWEPSHPVSLAQWRTWMREDDENETTPTSPGCGCTELCSMGPTCPGGMLAGLRGSGCARMQAGGEG